MLASRSQYPQAFRPTSWLSAPRRVSQSHRGTLSQRYARAKERYDFSIAANRRAANGLPFPWVTLRLIVDAATPRYFATTEPG